MDVVWLVIAGFVLALWVFSRDLLIARGSFKVIFGVSLAFFIASILLTAVNYRNPILFPSLINPLASFGLFAVMRKLFLRWKKREPIDTFADWTPGLAADRWFNILYFCLAVFLMMGLYIASDLTGYKWY